MFFGVHLSIHMYKKINREKKLQMQECSQHMSNDLYIKRHIGEEEEEDE